MHYSGCFLKKTVGFAPLVNTKQVVFGREKKSDL